MPVIGGPGPVLVGQANPDPLRPPFDGRSGRFLARLLGLGLPRFLELFECRNLLRADGRRLAKGREFGPAQVAEARAAAGLLDLRGRTVVAAGLNVARALGAERPRLMGFARLGRGEELAAVLPHPSGIVRWWNDGLNRLEARALLEALLERCWRAGMADLRACRPGAPRED